MAFDRKGQKGQRQAEGARTGHCKSVAGGKSPRQLWYWVGMGNCGDNARTNWVGGQTCAAGTTGKVLPNLAKRFRQASRQTCPANASLTMRQMPLAAGEQANNGSFSGIAVGWARWALPAGIVCDETWAQRLLSSAALAWIWNWNRDGRRFYLSLPLFLLSPLVAVSAGPPTALFGSLSSAVFCRLLSGLHIHDERAVGWHSFSYLLSRQHLL